MYLVVVGGWVKCKGRNECGSGGGGGGGGLETDFEIIMAGPWVLLSCVCRAQKCWCCGGGRTVQSENQKIGDELEAVFPPPTSP